MDLGNSIEIVVHHLPIGRMACLGHWDQFPMVSALVYVMHTKQGLRWIMMQDCQLSWFISYYTAWTLNLEKILSMCQNQKEVLTYRWDPKVVIYPYRLSYNLCRLVATNILNKGTMISHGIEILCPLGWSKRQ